MKEQIIKKIKEAKSKAKKREVELSKIRKALSTHRRRNLELQRINKAIKEFRLKTMKLENGTPLEAEKFAPGESIFIINEMDKSLKIALPVGTYTLADGKKLVCDPEGIIKNIM